MRGTAAKMKFKKLWVAFSLPLLLIIGTNPAFAGFTSLLNGQFTSSTGAWGSQIASANGNGSTSAYTINWNGLGSKQYEFISIINTGTFDLLFAGITLSSAKQNGDTTNAPILSFQACTGTWNLTSGACSETPTLLSAASAGYISLNVGVTVGNRVIIKIDAGKSGGGSFVSTLNTLTSRNDIRAGLVRHS